MKVKSLSHVQLLATPWTAAYQALFQARVLEWGAALNAITYLGVLIVITGFSSNHV